MPARRELPHIFLPDPRAEAYGGRKRAIQIRRPTIEDPEQHAAGLLRRFDELTHQSQTAPRSPIQAIAERQGFLIEVQGFPGFELNLTPLASRRQDGLDVRAVTIEKTTSEEEIQRAVVFVPFGKVEALREKLESYRRGERTLKGNRKNAALAETIQDFNEAVLRSLWTDPDQFPDDDQAIWWEVWLRRQAEPLPGETGRSDPGLELDRFRRAATEVGIRLRPRALVFTDRTVVVAFGTGRALAAAFEALDDLAEVRRARDTAEFFRALPAAEQMEFIEELLERTAFAGSDAPAVCVLDTGVNRAHPLLAPSLEEAHHLACLGWTADDHHGHGTEMAGLALYGDLVEVLGSQAPVELRHQLESVKILPPPEMEHPPEEDGPDLWGAITAEACARAEIAAPFRRRCFSIAVTASP